MAFGVYVHIPYCLQKCHYCDFITLDMDHAVSPAQYTSLLIEEIRNRSSAIKERRLSSLYFGGGTPSVLGVDAILAIRQEIANNGFEFENDAEVTVEINPGTVTKHKLDQYLAAGVNRFSVGVQTFHSEQLKRTGRLHSVEDSRSLLAMLRDAKVNYSFDLLFGLPNQSPADLERDLTELNQYNPPHVSLYNLTVPKQHEMNKNRAPDDVQADMFDQIESALAANGLKRYEISNFARPGFESKHNYLYWTDQGYWGVGIGAHSYLPAVGDFGTRFWNPASVDVWAKQLYATSGASAPDVAFYKVIPQRQVEPLKLHESLTDYCHTALRKTEGLSVELLTKKYGPATANLTLQRLLKLCSGGALLKTTTGFSMTPTERPRANAIFLELTFLAEELP